MIKSCCFIGHKKINATEQLSIKLTYIVEELIKQGVYQFIFGSKSEFNDFSLDAVTNLKAKFPLIERIYIRAEYEHIDTNYETYLLESYDETYFSKKARNSGKLVYIKRNEEMIDLSDVCIFYYNCSSFQKNSGTKLAFEYARKKTKFIVNLF